MVVGTTGWYQEIEQVRNLVDQHKTGFLYAANFSIGVNLFLEVARTAAEALRHDYSGQIFERHYAQKKDAPSGTALAIQHVIQQASRKNEDLEITSFREGDVVGMHEVVLESSADRIYLCHDAKSRRAFAEGAVRGAEWLAGKKGFLRFQGFVARLVVVLTQLPKEGRHATRISSPGCRVRDRWRCIRSRCPNRSSDTPGYSEGGPCPASGIAHLADQSSKHRDLLSRLQMQQGAVARASERLDEARSKLAEIQVRQREVAGEVKRLEDASQCRREPPATEGITGPDQPRQIRARSHRRHRAAASSDRIQAEQQLRPNRIN